MDSQGGQHFPTGRTRILGVAGWPVEHSLSPRLQNAALRAAGLDYVYLAFPIPPERFEQAVRGLAAAGVVGLNCTIPHKTAALRLCDAVDAEARLVQAVNTLHFRPDGIHGTNTDCEGYLETVRREGGLDLAGATVTQFGAGGAGRAMALGALRGGARRLVLVNRTPEKAQALAADLLGPYPQASVEVLDPGDDAALRRALGGSALVSNATSLGLRATDPAPCDPAWIAAETLVFDAAYTAGGRTAWLEAAAARGLRVLDGLGMLVRQGAGAFRYWTGVEPDAEAMFASVGRRAGRAGRREDPA